MSRLPAVMRRGVALILALGFIALMSLLVVGVLDTLRVRLVEGERRAQVARLRVDADSALAVVQARLAVFRMDDAGVYLNAADLEAIAADPLAGFEASSGATVTVRLRDESGLFQLNTTDVAALREFFTDLGVDEEVAVALADSLADWIDPDDNARLAGAESEAYGTPGLPANRAIRRFAELRNVKGFAEVFFNADGTPNELGRQLAECVTLLVSDGMKPNVNTAPESVLRVLAVRTGADAAAILSFRTPLNYPADRRHQGVFESAAQLGLVGAPPALGARVSYAARRIRVTIRVRKGDLLHVNEVLLAPAPAQPKAPLTVKARVDSGLLDDLR